MTHIYCNPFTYYKLLLIMKKITILSISLIFFSFLLVPNIHTEETKYKTYTDIGPLEKTGSTIVEVISDPDKFHREVITVEGEISQIEYKKLITGKKFTLFKLEDTQENKIKVYARGYIKELKNGSKIRIYGRYTKEKSFFFSKYKNVMKARKIQILNS